VQTSIAEESLETAARLAEYLQRGMHCEWAIITAEKAGAAAASTRHVLSVPAFRAEVRHTHCADAAFSGGLIYGLLLGRDMQDCLELASASGAVRCEREQNEPLPTLSQLTGVMQERQRRSAPAA
jgi:sugar/nucleoside kinase (ribokinase family)